MTLVISKGITLRKGWQPMDSDAAAYITAVETADTEPLEEKTKIAIDNFVLGCKADGIWSAIKASCILAGARTLTGALVPLTGTAPSQVGTAGGWNYTRKTGLAGNGTDNYLDSNRNNNADPQDNKHLSVYVTATLVNGTRFLIGNRGITDSPSWILWRNTNDFRTRLNQTLNTDYTTQDLGVGFKGISRLNASDLQARYARVTYSGSRASASPLNENITVFSASGSNVLPSTTRLAFYSIGESLDLALLDARVTDLINAFAAAIP
jgi:hypothetical protein